MDGLLTFLLLFCLQVAGIDPTTHGDCDACWLASEAEVVTAPLRVIEPVDDEPGPPDAAHRKPRHAPETISADRSHPILGVPWGLQSRLLRRLLDPVVLLL